MSTTITKVSSYRTWQNNGTTVVGSGGTGGDTIYDFASLLTNYYTKTDLQTDGSSSVNFDNITEAYHNNLLDIQGGIDTSSGDSSGYDAQYYHLDYSTYTLLTTAPGINKYLGTNGLGVLGWYDYEVASGGAIYTFAYSLIEDSVDVVTLVNDEDVPGSLKYYGTDVSGVKGWHDLSITELGSSGDWGIYTFSMSLVNDGTGDITLVGDSASPGNNKLYGTDAGGTKGWYDIPTAGSTEDSSGLAYVSAYGTPLDNQLAIWVDEDTIEGSPNLSYDGRTFVFGGYPIDIPDAGFTNISIGTILEGYTDGEGNVFIGLYAGSLLSGGDENVGIGSNALTSVDSGNNNVAIGYNSLGGLTSASRNIAIGSYTLANSTAGESNIAFGYETMENCLGSYNIGIGDEAIRFLSDGSNNIAIGYQAGLSITSTYQGNLSGSNSIYIGPLTKSLDTGQENEVVIGYDAVGKGNDTVVIGNYNTIGTYLAGEIYFINYSESSGGSDTTGSLPLADSAITQIVMYDPDTGKLYYGAGTGVGVEYTFGMSLDESAGTVTLDGDSASPGNSKYYGTDSGGTKGWFDLPAGGDMDSSAITEYYVFDMSLNEDSVGVVTLDNDLASPGNTMYYGTNETGVKGWNQLIKPFQTEAFTDPLEIDCVTYKDWICTLTGDCTVNINNLSDGDSGMLELIIDGSSSGDTLTVTFGTMWTKKMGPTDFDGTDGADNIISWRAIGDGSTQEIVYTIGIIE